jgi:flagellin
MISPVNNNLTGLVFESQNDKIELEQSLAKLSSGKKNLRVGEDSGSHSQGAKLSSKNLRDIANVQNLQNFLSFSQSQDGILEQAGKILHRMDELATRALDVTATDGDRENYNKEFIELADQLSEFAREKFGDINLFGGGTAGIDYIKGTGTNDFNYSQNINDADTGSIRGEDANGGSALGDAAVIANNGAGGAAVGDFTSPDDGASPANAKRDLLYDYLDGTAGSWLKDTEDLVKAQLGWEPIPAGGGSPNPPRADDDWELRVNTTGNGAVAFIYGGTGNVIKFEIDLSTLDTSDADPKNWNVGGISFDRVVAHEMVHLLQNQNTHGSDPIGDGSRGSWLKEGLAEFIHGADERVFGILGNNPSDDDIRDLINAIGTGNEDWSANDQYAAAYLAVRFLDAEIKDAGFSDTVTNFASGTFTSSDGVKHLTAWMRSKYDSGASAADSGFNAYISTFLGDKSYSNNSEFIDYFKGTTGMDVAIDGDGSTYESKAISSITISDTNSYNLNSIEKAKETLTLLSTKVTALAEQRSLVGANMSRVQNEIQNLNGKIMTGEMAVGRIQDTDVATESTKFASSQVRMQASIAILAQAKDLNVGIRDLIRGIMIGQS